MNREDFIDYRKYTPVWGKEVIVITKTHGRRRGIPGGISGLFMGFFLTDCAHPLQNCSLPFDEIILWCYANKEDRDNIADLIIENKEARREEADKILSTIKPTFFSKLKNLISWNRKHTA